MNLPSMSPGKDMDECVCCVGCVWVGGGARGRGEGKGEGRMDGEGGQRN